MFLELDQEDFDLPLRQVMPSKGSVLTISSDEVLMLEPQGQI